MDKMNGNIHNEMAEFAFRKVTEAAKSKNSQKEFRSLARSFPSMIQVNGLGAAIAFLHSKSKNNAHQQMYELLKQWLCPGDRHSNKNKEDLMKYIVNLNSDTYRLCTNEAMNLCLWVKRFAEGMIDGEANKSEGK